MTRVTQMINPATEDTGPPLFSLNVYWLCLVRFNYIFLPDLEPHNPGCPSIHRNPVLLNAG